MPDSSYDPIYILSRSASLRVLQCEIMSFFIISNCENVKYVNSGLHKASTEIQHCLPMPLVGARLKSANHRVYKL